MCSSMLIVTKGLHTERAHVEGKIVQIGPLIAKQQLALVTRAILRWSLLSWQSVRDGCRQARRACGAHL